jgi:hypothetical protein
MRHNTTTLVPLVRECRRQDCWHDASTETPELSPALYADLIDLYIPFDRTSQVRSYQPTLLRDIADWLLEDAGTPMATLPPDERDLRWLITYLLTIRPPRPIPRDVQRWLDDLLAAEAARRGVVSIDEIAADARSSLSVNAPTRLRSRARSCASAPSRPHAKLLGDAWTCLMPDYEPRREKLRVIGRAWLGNLRRGFPTRIG